MLILSWVLNAACQKSRSLWENGNIFLVLFMPLAEHMQSFYNRLCRGEVLDDRMTCTHNIKDTHLLEDSPTTCPPESPNAGTAIFSETAQTRWQAHLTDAEILHSRCTVVQVICRYRCGDLPLSDGDLVRDGDNFTRPRSPQVDSVLQHLGMVGSR